MSWRDLAQGHWGRSTPLLAVGAAMVTVVAVGNSFGLLGAQNDIQELRADNAEVRSVAAQLSSGLEEANRRLEKAGEAPVPVPTTIAGPAGANGANGANGPPGANGINGVDGAPGASGAPGPAGPPGPPGPEGPSGANGADGAPGANGADGANGPKGDPGGPGPVGPSGPAGAPGEPPSSWTFSVFGAEFACSRTDPFDPASPTYTCAPSQTPSESAR